MQILITHGSMARTRVLQLQPLAIAPARCSSSCAC